MYGLTTAGLHADLQTQVVNRAHHPQVAGGSDVKLQPALLSCPQPAGVQQEQVCLPRGTPVVRFEQLLTP